MSNHSLPSVIIIGAGPAGLMAAEMLSTHAVNVAVYDAMPSVARKLLMAGKGGLNLTHSEALDTFLTRYGDKRIHLEAMLRAFTADDLRLWAKGLGVDTFVGSSGRVFPTDMKAAPLLRAWLQRLRHQGVKFHVRHRWLGWQNSLLHFTTPQGEQLLSADAVILALGGGSWQHLGSTGTWVNILQAQGINIAPLQPSNCGFDVAWSAYFAEHFAGAALKSVQLRFGQFQQRGELVVTETGLEGGLLYAASALLRDACLIQGYADIELDLAPNQTLAQLTEKLASARGKSSLANFLRKQANISGVKANILREVLSANDFNQAPVLAQTIKALPLRLIAPRPLNEAISTAGGVKFNELTEHLMLKKLTGVFCAGEMLDWEAPTGGYLLTACFATGKAAALGLLTYLNKSKA